MQIVILAAGLGLRLRPFTETKPKALIPVAGTPLLLRTLESLPLDSVNEIIIVIGWLGEQIKAVVGNTYAGIPVQYALQEPLNGTGGSVHAAKHLLHDKFLVLNGDDIYTRKDLQTLADSPSWALLGAATTRPLAAAIETTPEGVITGFSANQTDAEKYINCGAYALDTDFFSLPLVPIPVRNGSEYSLPHTLIQDPQNHPVQLFPATQWLPVGSPEELAKAEKIMQNI